MREGKEAGWKKNVFWSQLQIPTIYIQYHIIPLISILSSISITHTLSRIAWYIVVCILHNKSPDNYLQKYIRPRSDLKNIFLAICFIVLIFSLLFLVSFPFPSFLPQKTWISLGFFTGKFTVTKNTERSDLYLFQIFRSRRHPDPARGRCRMRHGSFFCLILITILIFCNIHLINIFRQIPLLNIDYYL